LSERKAELAQQFPGSVVEVWSFDEHRLGLKPILRKVWARVGERPLAAVNYRYEWTYLYGFVEPATGKTEWLVLPRVNIEWFNQALEVFAQQTGAGVDKQILLVLDGAGWHRSEQVVVPEGIHLELLPPYSPELQPAERLWRVADEPLVNRSFETIDELEDILCDRCVTLSSMTDEIRALTYYHWWP
jgi:transposase